MHLRKQQQLLNVIDAMDNLSLLAELNPREKIEKLQPQEFKEEELHEHITRHSWYDPANLALNQQKVRDTFRILFNYVKTLYENEEGQLKNPDLQKAIQAMMLLAMEAAANLSAFLAKLPHGQAIEKVTAWEEYKQLEQFYLNSIAPQFQNKLEMEEKWQEQWGVGLEDEVNLSTRRGIEDIEGVRQDKDYELFLIRRDEGLPFFNRSLLRHMHLVEQFDEIVVDPKEEDALAKVKNIKDREARERAEAILESTQVLIDDFFKRGTKHKELPFVAHMSKTVMALMLAANPRNLMEATAGKSCRHYLKDFHFYLRMLLSSKDYQEWSTRPPAHSERLAHIFLHLTRALCRALFLSNPSTKPMDALIHQLIERGKESFEIASPTHSPLKLWNVLSDEDVQIRSMLRRSSYGPLRKAIALFENEKDYRGFDPIFQGNLPRYLFSLKINGHDIAVLHLPCPTRQDQIRKADIVQEFYIFAAVLQEEKQTHLLINLQDRTGWQEYARCLALEELQKEYTALKCLTLATGTDFYLQSGTYQQLDEAQLFIEQFKEQIAGGEECGFYFPDVLKIKGSFIDAAMHMIHTVFFGGKEVLLHKNRIDFIEIFYLFFVLKCIEEISPQSISFTSKDGIDSAAGLNALLFGFSCIVATTALSEEQGDFLRYLFYSAALLVRERAIDSFSLGRTLSALSIINAGLEAHREKVLKEIRKLVLI